MVLDFEVLGSEDIVPSCSRASALEKRIRGNS